MTSEQFNKAIEERYGSKFVGGALCGNKITVILQSPKGEFKRFYFNDISTIKELNDFTFEEMDSFVNEK